MKILYELIRKMSIKNDQCNYKTKNNLMTTSKGISK